MPTIMSVKNNPNFTYLGDGAYAEFDGYGVWVRANHHLESECTSQVYLEPDVFERLAEFFKERRGG